MPTAPGFVHSKSEFSEDPPLDVKEVWLGDRRTMRLGNPTLARQYWAELATLLEAALQSNCTREPSFAGKSGCSATWPRGGPRKLSKSLMGLRSCPRRPLRCARWVLGTSTVAGCGRSGGAAQATLWLIEQARSVPKSRWQDAPEINHGLDATTDAMSSARSWPWCYDKSLQSAGLSDKWTRL